MVFDHIQVSNINMVFVLFELSSVIIVLFQGYCAEYNTLGKGIFPHFNLRCSDVTPPCDSRYISTDAYLCKLFILKTLEQKTV